MNKRLIRDRLLMHAITEAYRNVIPPTSFPVVLLFLEMPPEEVDVNVHPAKTEVRFRQQTLVHDFVRDSLRTALVQGAAGGRISGCAGFAAHGQPFADAAGGFAACRGPADRSGPWLVCRSSGSGCRTPSRLERTQRPSG